MRVSHAVCLLAALLFLSARSEAATISYSFGTQACGVVTTATGTCDGGLDVFNWSAFGDLDTLQLAMDFSRTNISGIPGVTIPSYGGGVTVSDFVSVIGGPVGTAGTMVFNWAIDGSLSVNGSHDFSIALMEHLAAPQGEWRACGSSAALCAGYDSVANETISISVPFVFGTPVLLHFALRGGTSGGEVAFFNTAQLQPLLVYDAAGTQIAASVVSDDNSQYLVSAPAAVPEPGLALLVGSGVLAFWAQRRKAA